MKRQLLLFAILAAIATTGSLNEAQAQTTISTGGLYTRYITTPGNYTITIKGGSGGRNGLADQNGATGASVTGTFALSSCDTLTIIVGGKGSFISSATQAGGGGGGSAVILNGNTLLLAAGGGGGAGRFTAGGGGLANTSPIAAGGSSTSAIFNGAGGGGFGFAGGASSSPCNSVTGGGAASLTALSAGGIGSSYVGSVCASGHGNGGSGFGGGGGMQAQGGGGGGGYAGGSGGGTQNGGSGGDSYVNASATGVITVPGAAGGAPANGIDGDFTINTTLATSPVFTLPTVTTTANANVSGNIDLLNDCDLVASVAPDGAAPVAGAVSGTVYYDGSVSSFNGQPYVQRHYDISPTTNPSTATAIITLYFRQAEFDAYNATSGTAFNLPTSGSDVVGKASLRITQQHGTSASGNPGTYTGWAGSGPANVAIDPADNDIVWNAAGQRWEVTFPVTGFSGFFVYGANNLIALPVKLADFTARNEGGSGNRLDWSTATEDAGSFFGIERSSDGHLYTAIGGVKGKGSNSAYTYYDEQPAPGISYYRLKIGEANGTESYSHVVAVRSDRSNGSVTIAPVPSSSSIRIFNTDGALLGQEAVIYDMQGREQYRMALRAEQSIDISGWAEGVYNLRLPNGEVMRIVKQ